MSAVPCAAVCVVWVHGRWCHDNASAGVGGRTYQWTSGSGRFIATRSEPGVKHLRVDGVRWSVEPPFRWDDLYGSPWLATPHPLGLAYVRTPWATGVLVPQWIVGAATAVLPAAWLVQRARRRPPPGACRRCGYDLRAAVSAVDWRPLASPARAPPARVRLGLCLACGYDLRHIPGKCPECGAATGRLVTGPRRPPTVAIASDMPSSPDLSGSA